VRFLAPAPGPRARTRTPFSPPPATVNAYAAGLRAYNNSNAPLQAAWSTLKWARAAELLRGDAAVDAAGVARMFQDVAMPHIGSCWRAGGNWDISMIEASLGVRFLPKKFDRAHQTRALTPKPRSLQLTL